MDWKNKYYQNDYTTQGKLQVQRNLCQITNGSFSLTRTTTTTTKIPKFYGDTKDPEKPKES